MLTFVDENWNRLYFIDFSQGMPNGHETCNKIYKMILLVLKEGIPIGNKKFEFLTFSPNQLRESFVCMLYSNDRVNVESICNWMDDYLSIKNVEKCATRMGQSFSCSIETLHVYKHKVKKIFWIFILIGVVDNICF